MRCEDFPCCGHEYGSCPDRSRTGKKCRNCGRRLLAKAGSICDTCLQKKEDSAEWDALSDAEILAEKHRKYDKDLQSSSM